MKSSRRRKSVITPDADTVWNLDLLQDSLVSHFSEPERTELSVPSATEQPSHEQFADEKPIAEKKFLSNCVTSTENISLDPNRTDTPSREIFDAESIKSSASSRTDSSRSRKGKRSRSRQGKKRTTEIEHTYVDLPNSKAVQCGGSGRVDEADIYPIQRSTSKSELVPIYAETNNQASSPCTRPDQITTDSDNEAKGRPKNLHSESPFRVACPTKEKRRGRRSRKQRSSSKSPPIPKRISCYCRQDYVRPRHTPMKNQQTITDLTGDTSRKAWVGTCDKLLRVKSLESLLAMRSPCVSQH